MPRVSHTKRAQHKPLPKLTMPVEALREVGEKSPLIPLVASATMHPATLWPLAGRRCQGPR
jgi:hypothetical protein